MIDLDRDAVLSDRRHWAEEAVAAGLVDATPAETDPLAEGKRLARSLAVERRRSFEALGRSLDAHVAAGFAVES
jgi:enoyl-CoA hydratase/carnithine racemase